MKRRIIIASIILVLLVGIGLMSYFLLRKNTLSEEQGSNLIVRAAIDMGVIDDYEDSPKLFEFKTGTGEQNIININALPSIKEISLISEDLTTELGIAEKDYIIELCLDILKIENIKQDKAYELDISGAKTNVAYKLVKNEVVFAYVDSVTENINIISFFYNSVDEEYEFISIENTSQNDEFNCSFKRIKGNSEGIVSYEEYELNGILGDDILEKIELGEGTTKVINVDYKNSIKKAAEYTKMTNPDDHFIVSNYVYQIYTNYNTSLEDLKDIILASLE